MREPLVSVVIPAFNAGRYLAGSVASALEQSWRSLEVLVVDDGSTDETPRIARELAAADPRVRVLAGENGGPARARNVGIRASRGEIVAFLDADDLWLPDKLERQIPLFSENPPPDVVYSQRLTIDVEGRLLEGYRPAIPNGRILPEMWIDNPVCMSSAVVRREVFDRIGLLDESLRMSEDFDFWLRAAVCCLFRGCPEPLVKYRVHGEQASRRTQERVQVAWEIRARFEARHGKLIDAATRRRARARHYATRGLREERAGERWRSLGCYLRALRFEPFNDMAMRGVVKALLPARVADLLRRGDRTAVKAGAS